jgi:hypothetical protein
MNLKNIKIKQIDFKEVERLSKIITEAEDRSKAQLVIDFYNLIKDSPERVNQNDINALAKLVQNAGE